MQLQFNLWLLPVACIERTPIPTQDSNKIPEQKGPQRRRVFIMRFYLLQDVMRSVVNGVSCRRLHCECPQPLPCLDVLSNSNGTDNTLN
jgi:hypothetical protein